jgi:hypothetical protein
MFPSFAFETLKGFLFCALSPGFSASDLKPILDNTVSKPYGEEGKDFIGSGLARASSVGWLDPPGFVNCVF